MAANPALKTVFYHVARKYLEVSMHRHFEHRKLPLDGDADKKVFV